MQCENFIYDRCANGNVAGSKAQILKYRGAYSAFQSLDSQKLQTCKANSSFYKHFHIILSL